LTEDGWDEFGFGETVLWIGVRMTGEPSVEFTPSVGRVVQSVQQGRGERGRIFVSYSRRDFNSAQQFTQILGRQGLDPWFDVERLTAGSDWSRSIDDAIDRADALVLLASPSALSSEYVAREWQRAGDKGIPRYIALIRNVALSLDFANSPAVDLRDKFELNAERLGCVLLEGSAVGLPPLLPSKASLPVPMLFVAGTLIFDFLAVLGYLTQGAVAVLSEERNISVGSGPWAGALGIPLVCVAFLVYVGGVLKGFAARRVGYRSIWAVLTGSVPFFALVGNLISGLVDALLHSQLDVQAFRTGNGYFAAYHVLTELAMLPVNIIALFYLLRSPALFRWLPAGDVPEGLRRRVLGPTASRAIGVTPRNRASTFWVSSAKADDAIAAEVACTFRAEGFTEASKADVSLVIVSNMTDWAWAEEQLRSRGAIAVLASSVHLPEEANELRRQQWVDHRSGHNGRIAALAKSLREPATAPSSEVARSPGQFTAPPPVRIASGALVALLTVFLGSAVLSVTVAQDSSYRRHPIPFSELTVPDPSAVTPDGRHKSASEVLCERLGWPATTTPGFPDCSIIRQLPKYDAMPWERPRIENPAYANRFPAAADTLLRVRALLGAVVFLLLLPAVWLVGRRRIQRRPLMIIALSAFGLVAVWVALAAFSKEQSGQLIALYVGIWVAVAAVVVAQWKRIGKWLPATRPDSRTRHYAVSPHLFQASIPIILLVLTALYARGTVL
jgi:TIR domain